MAVTASQPIPVSLLAHWLHANFDPRLLVLVSAGRRHCWHVGSGNYDRTLNVQVDYRPAYDNICIEHLCRVHRVRHVISGMAGKCMVVDHPSGEAC